MSQLAKEIAEEINIEVNDCSTEEGMWRMEALIAAKLEPVREELREVYEALEDPTEADWPSCASILSGVLALLSKEDDANNRV